MGQLSSRIVLALHPMLSAKHMVWGYYRLQMPSALSPILASVLYAVHIHQTPLDPLLLQILHT